MSFDNTDGVAQEKLNWVIWWSSYSQSTGEINWVAEVFKKQGLHESNYGQRILHLNSCMSIIIDTIPRVLAL